MGKEKIGGYDTDLRKHVKRLQKEEFEYEKGYDEGQLQAHPEDAELARVITSSIDTEKLKSVFFDFLRKSGVPIEHANISVLDNIVTRPLRSRDIVASYAQLNNQIKLSLVSDKFKKAKEFLSRNEAIPPDLFMEIQLTLIHEICHAFSRNRLITEGEGTAKSTMKSESGYDTNVTKVRQRSGKFLLSHKHRFFVALNEGVTQRLAEEIFLEYSRRTGDGGDAEKFLRRFVKERTQELWLYTIYANQVDSICEQIASYTGVAKTDVWNAFKRGYFANPELFVAETIELFRETFGDGFLNEYAKMGGKTFKGALADFEIRSNIPSPEEGYAKKWLQHLGII